MKIKYMGLGGCILILVVLGVILLFSGKEPENSSTKKEPSYQNLESHQEKGQELELNDEVIIVESDNKQTVGETHTSPETSISEKEPERKEETAPKDEDVDTNKPSEDMADEEWTKDYKIEF